MADYRKNRNITIRKAEKRLDPGKGYHGLFAREPIARGEIVWVSYLRPEDCDIYRWAEIKDDPIKVRYSYQIGEDAFSVSREVENDVSNFFNHACDPNTWYDRGEATKAAARILYEVTALPDEEMEYIVARRDIAPDEEITMDYATFWVVGDLEFTCRCASPRCRKNLRKDDYRLQDPEHTSIYVRSLLLTHGGSAPKPPAARP